MDTKPIFGAGVRPNDKNNITSVGVRPTTPTTTTTTCSTSAGVRRSYLEASKPVPPPDPGGRPPAPNGPPGPPGQDRDRHVVSTWTPPPMQAVAVRDQRRAMQASNNPTEISQECKNLSREARRRRPREPPGGRNVAGGSQTFPAVFMDSYDCMPSSSSSSSTSSGRTILPNFDDILERKNRLAALLKPASKTINLRPRAISQDRHAGLGKYNISDDQMTIAQREYAEKCRPASADRNYNSGNYVSAEMPQWQTARSASADRNYSSCNYGSADMPNWRDNSMCKYSSNVSQNRLGPIRKGPIRTSNRFDKNGQPLYDIRGRRFQSYENEPVIPALPEIPPFQSIKCTFISDKYGIDIFARSRKNEKGGNVIFARKRNLEKGGISISHEGAFPKNTDLSFFKQSVIPKNTETPFHPNATEHCETFPNLQTKETFFQSQTEKQHLAANNLLKPNATVHGTTFDTVNSTTVLSNKNTDLSFFKQSVIPENMETPFNSNATEHCETISQLENAKQHLAANKSVDNNATVHGATFVTANRTTESAFLQNADLSLFKEGVIPENTETPFYPNATEHGETIFNLQTRETFMQPNKSLNPADAFTHGGETFFQSQPQKQLLPENKSLNSNATVHGATFVMTNSTDVHSNNFNDFIQKAAAAFSAPLANETYAENENFVTLTPSNLSQSIAAHELNRGEAKAVNQPETESKQIVTLTPMHLPKNENENDFDLKMRGETESRPTGISPLQNKKLQDVPNVSRINLPIHVTSTMQARPINDSENQASVSKATNANNVFFQTFAQKRNENKYIDESKISSANSNIDYSSISSEDFSRPEHAAAAASENVALCTQLTDNVARTYVHAAADSVSTCVDDRSPRQRQPITSFMTQIMPEQAPAHLAAPSQAPNQLTPFPATSQLTEKNIRMRLNVDNIRKISFADSNMKAFINSTENYENAKNTRKLIHPDPYMNQDIFSMHSSDACSECYNETFDYNCSTCNNVAERSRIGNSERTLPSRMTIMPSQSSSSSGGAVPKIRKIDSSNNANRVNPTSLHPTSVHYQEDEFATSLHPTSLHHQGDEFATSLHPTSLHHQEDEFATSLHPTSLHYQEVTGPTSPHLQGTPQYAEDKFNSQPGHFPESHYERAELPDVMPSAEQHSTPVSRAPEAKINRRKLKMVDTQDQPHSHVGMSVQPASTLARMPFPEMDPTTVARASEAKADPLTLKLISTQNKDYSHVGVSHLPVRPDAEAEVPPQEEEEPHHDTRWEYYRAPPEPPPGRAHSRMPPPWTPCHTCQGSPPPTGCPSCRMHGGPTSGQRTEAPKAGDDRCYACNGYPPLTGCHNCSHYGTPHTSGRQGQDGDQHPSAGNHYQHFNNHNHPHQSTYSDGNFNTGAQGSQPTSGGNFNTGTTMPTRTPTPMATLTPARRVRSQQAEAQALMLTRAPTPMATLTPARRVRSRQAEAQASMLTRTPTPMATITTPTLRVPSRQAEAQETMRPSVLILEATIMMAT